MRPSSFVRSVVDRIVVTRRIPVQGFDGSMTNNNFCSICGISNTFHAHTTSTVPQYGTGAPSLLFKRSSQNIYEDNKAIITRQLKAHTPLRIKYLDIKCN